MPDLAAQWALSPPNPQQLYSTTPSFWQANGVTVSFADVNGSNLQTTTPDVATTVNAIDGDGHTYCTSDATNVGAWMTAHPTGRYPYLCPSTPPSSPPSLGSNPDYTTTIFDAAGRTASTTDQVGDTTSYTYDPNGNKLTTTDPRGNVTTDCYYYENASGHCAAVAPATGGSAGDLYSQTTPATSADPSGEVTTYTYFPGDLADTTTTPAGTSTDSYDAMDDLTSTTYSNTAAGYETPANLSYTYYVDGTKHTMTDATGTTTYTDDANGDVTGQSLAPATGSGLASASTSYSYFTTGAVSGVTYPSYTGYSSPQATYTYDATGNMASVTDWLGNTVDFGHDGDGNLTSQENAVSLVNPSGTSGTAYSYDAADLNTGTTSTMASSCTLTQGFSGSTGSLNADGLVTHDSEQTTSGCPIQLYNYQRYYSYDPASRAVYQGTTAQGTSANNFAYDASGDPTTISSHDSSGNFDTYTQTFDNAGEDTGQTPVTGSSGSASTYSYDTRGDQTQTTTASSTTTDGYSQLGQMVTSSGTSPAVYSYNGAGLQSTTVTQSGTGWSSGSAISSSNPMNAVSCSSATFCVAVGNNGRESSFNGTSWSSTSTIDSGHNLRDVSCPTSSFCMAVDNAGNALEFNGSSWSSANIDSTRTLLVVSCPTSSFCAAVDGSGYAQIYSSGSWLSSASNVDGAKSINGLSCPASSFCLAVDSDGRDLTYNGSSWSSATTIDGTSALKAVSCPTTSHCVAVDRVGNELTYINAAWSSADDIDGSNVLDAVSCPTTTFCEAADQSGNTFEYNGVGWSSASNIDSTNSLTGVSCLSSSSCEAVDARSGSGYGFTYAASIAQSTWDTKSLLASLLSDGTNDYINGPIGEPVEQVNITSSPPTNNPVFMTYTPSNSSWLTTNVAGQEVTYYRFDAFGTLAIGTPGSSFGYAGQYTDPASGLSDMRQRWYAQQHGAFTSRDPMFSSTDQSYTYAGDDPVNRNDPSGNVPDLFPNKNVPNNTYTAFTYTIQVVDPIGGAIVGNFTCNFTIIVGTYVVGFAGVRLDDNNCNTSGPDADLARAQIFTDDSDRIRDGPTRYVNDFHNFNYSEETGNGIAGRFTVCQQIPSEAKPKYIQCGRFVASPFFSDTDRALEGRGHFYIG